MPEVVKDLWANHDAEGPVVQLGVAGSLPTTTGARVDNEALWERNAAWWQREFTGGADVEYAEQILPLIARHLRGARRCSTSGAERVRSPVTSRRSARR